MYDIFESTQRWMQKPWFNLGRKLNLERVSSEWENMRTLFTTARSYYILIREGAPAPAQILADALNEAYN